MPNHLGLDGIESKAKLCGESAGVVRQAEDDIQVTPLLLCAGEKPPLFLAMRAGEFDFSLVQFLQNS
jgi:hypothetical protein